MKKSLLPLALGGLGIGVTEFTIMGMLPDVARDLHVSIPAVGYFISTYALGVVVGAPLLVVAMDRHPNGWSSHGCHRNFHFPIIRQTKQNLAIRYKCLKRCATIQDSIIYLLFF